MCLSDGGSIQFVCLSASHLVVLPVYPSVGLSVSSSSYQRLMAVVMFISYLSTVKVKLASVGCDEVEASQVSIFVKL